MKLASKHGNKALEVLRKTDPAEVVHAMKPGLASGQSELFTESSRLVKALSGDALEPQYADHYSKGIASLHSDTRKAVGL